MSLPFHFVAFAPTRPIKDAEVQRVVDDLIQYLAPWYEAVATELNARLLLTNLGTLTVADTATTGMFTFASGREEPDTSYSVAVTPVTVTGAAAAGASRVRSVSKATGGVTVTVEAAPGAGTSVGFDVVIGRIPAP